MSDVTQLLQGVGQGDPQAAEKLLPLVYAELRRLATHKMANEPAGLAAVVGSGSVAITYHLE